MGIRPVWGPRKVRSRRGSTKKTMGGTERKQINDRKIPTENEPAETDILCLCLRLPGMVATGQSPSGASTSQYRVSISLLPDRFFHALSLDREPKNRSNRTTMPPSVPAANGWHHAQSSWWNSVPSDRAQARGMMMSSFAFTRVSHLPAF